MEDSDELKASGDETNSSAPIQVRKNISLKLQPGGKKSTKSASAKKIKRRKLEKTIENIDNKEKNVNQDQEVTHVSTKLADSGDPLHMNTNLKWDHKVALLGEKTQGISIHCCEFCDRPILTYGRMLPCKHIFCFKCAKKNCTKCLRCQQAVSRVEQCELGKVYVCMMDGNGKGGCKRTYLSIRDLHAHVNYRHRGTNADTNIQNNLVTTNVSNLTSVFSQPDNSQYQRNINKPIPLRTSNLITVPLQDGRQMPIVGQVQQTQNFPNFMTPFSRAPFNPSVPPPNFTIAQQLPNFQPHLQTQNFFAVNSRNWGVPGPAPGPLQQRPHMQQTRTGFFNM